MVVNNNKPKNDWVHLPQGAQEVSLWSCLHDGALISAESDLIRHFVELEFSVKHLLNDLERKDQVHFVVRIEDATSVRAIGHFRPLQKFEEPKNSTPEERDLLLKEYYGKWREESLSWPDFETALVTDPLLITDSSFVSMGEEMSLRLGGFLDGEKFDDIFFDVFIRGKRLTASRNDGRDFSLDAFIELGRRYWDNFGKRQRGE